MVTPDSTEYRDLRMLYEGGWEWFSACRSPVSSGIKHVMRSELRKILMNNEYNTIRRPHLDSMKNIQR